MPKCQICSKTFNMLSNHIKCHGLSKEQYKNLYPGCMLNSFDLEKFIKKASLIHNNRYDYSKTQIDCVVDKIIIICKEHGEFKQSACAHIDQKQGCPKCCHTVPWTKEKLVKVCNEKYQDQIKVIQVSEKRGKNAINIFECLTHGQFSKSFNGILRSKFGCQKCGHESRMKKLKTGFSSKAEKKWLDSLNVPVRQYKLTICNKSYIVDGYDPKTNTIYEYYGSYWHGNPKIYNRTEYNTLLNKTYGQLYQETMKREKLIKTKYNFVSTWG